MKRFALAAALFVLLLTPVVAAQSLRDIRVDCNRGGNLAVALARAAKQGEVTVRVSGTCVGNFTLSGQLVTLMGDGPDKTVLRGNLPGYPVLQIADADRVSVEQLTLSNGSMGAYVRSGRDAAIKGCIVENNDVGVHANSGSWVYLERCTVQTNRSGVVATFGSQADLLYCTVRDNPSVGVVAEANSRLNVMSSDLARNFVGVAALGGSHIQVTGGTLTEHETDVSLRLNSYGILSSTVGTEGGSNARAVEIDSGSRLLVSGGTVHGGLRAASDSHFDIDHAEIRGAVTLRGFSNASITNGTIIDAGVTCTAGADAFCDGSRTTITGCSSAPPDCTVRSAEEEATPDLPALPSLNELLPRIRIPSSGGDRLDGKD